MTFDGTPKRSRNYGTKEQTTMASRKSDQTAGGIEPKGFGLRLMDQIQNEGTVHTEGVAAVEAITKRNLVVYESFFSHPAGIIDDPDAEWIERLVTSIDLTKYPDTLDLMIHSLGGSPTTAEKVILTCRSFAKSFRVIVPRTAMSAATLIAMGSDEIVMTETSEIGPIDPQMRLQTPQGVVSRPAAAFVDAYLDLVNKMQDAIKKNEPPHPFAELLRKLDPAWIQVCVKARQLAEKIALDCLMRYMLNGQSEADVRTVIANFLTEGEEFSHGRAIRAEKASKYGLKTEIIPRDGPLWEAVSTLHTRCENYVQSRAFAKYFVCRAGGINVNVRQVQIN